MTSSGNMPLVTVNILSYNRKDELRNTLAHIYSQKYEPIEVVVVDNASTDGSAAMVRAEFSDATLIALDKNIGIAGWNEGFKIAMGKYVFVLDDDSYPLEDTIGLTVEYIERETLCGVVACHITQLGRSGYERWKGDTKGIADFIGCGALLRTSLVRELNGFSPLIFLYYHEIEYAMNVYEAGYRIDYLQAADVIHRRSIVHRKAKKTSSRDLRFHYHLIRNVIIIGCMHFSPRIVGLKVIRFMAGQILFCAVHGNIVMAAKAFGDGAIAVVKNLANRKVLKKDTQMFFLKTGFMPGFFGDGIYSFGRSRLLARKPSERRNG